jgi:hypothetical protein
VEVVEEVSPKLCRGTSNVRIVKLSSVLGRIFTRVGGFTACNYGVKELRLLV